MRKLRKIKFYRLSFRTIPEEVPGTDEKYKSPFMAGGLPEMNPIEALIANRGQAQDPSIRNVHVVAEDISEALEMSDGIIEKKEELAGIAIMDDTVYIK